MESLVSLHPHLCSLYVEVPVIEHLLGESIVQKWQVKSIEDLHLGILREQRRIDVVVEDACDVDEVDLDIPPLQQRLLK